MKNSLESSLLTKLGRSDKSAKVIQQVGGDNLDSDFDCFNDYDKQNKTSIGEYDISADISTQTASTTNLSLSILQRRSKSPFLTQKNIGLPTSIDILETEQINRTNSATISTRLSDANILKIQNANLKKTGDLDAKQSKTSKKQNDISKLTENKKNFNVPTKKIELSLIPSMQSPGNKFSLSSKSSNNKPSRSKSASQKETIETNFNKKPTILAKENNPNLLSKITCETENNAKDGEHGKFTLFGALTPCSIKQKSKPNPRLSIDNLNKVLKSFSKTSKTSNTYDLEHIYKTNNFYGRKTSKKSKISTYIIPNKSTTSLTRSKSNLKAKNCIKYFRYPEIIKNLYPFLCYKSLYNLSNSSKVFRSSISQSLIKKAQTRLIIKGLSSSDQYLFYASQVNFKHLCSKFPNQFLVEHFFFL